MADNDTRALPLDFYVDGPAAIFYSQQDCEATGYKAVANANLLGLTEGGATISYQLMLHRINGDEYGGSEGMPAEQLILGAQATIRAQITKWAPGAFDDLKVGAYMGNADPGTIPKIGSPYFSRRYGYAFWVVAYGEGKGYYFPKCELATQPKQWNVSSLERRVDLNVLAYNVFTKTTVNGSTVKSADVFFSAADTFTLDADCAKTFTIGD